MSVSGYSPTNLRKRLAEAAEPEVAGAGTDWFRKTQTQRGWVAVAADCAVMHVESGATS